MNYLRPEPRPTLTQAHRWTDEFAAYVGFSVRAESSKNLKQRLKRIQNVARLAERLTKALSNDDLIAECRVRGGSLRTQKIQKIASSISSLVKDFELHIEKVKAKSGRGKKWDSGLRHHHVYMTALLCEFIDHTFEPARNGDNSALLQAAELLAEPIFEPGTKFSGAARKHIDDWNSAKRERNKKIREANMLAHPGRGG